GVRTVDVEDPGYALDWLCSDLIS
ncbi:hypothetical protein EAH_00068600, partial [Eimeria acervulina]